MPDTIHTLPLQAVLVRGHQGLLVQLVAVCPDNGAHTIEVLEMGRN